MNRLAPATALILPALLGWTTASFADAYSFSDISVQDFTVSALTGTAQPTSGVTGNGFAPGPSSNAVNFDSGTGNGPRSSGALDAPQLCFGAACSTITENTFSPTVGSNFVRADSQITTLNTFGTGTSFQLVAESQQAPGSGLKGESFGVLSMAQTFALSQSSQVDIAFLASALLKATLDSSSVAQRGFSLPDVLSEVTIRQGTAGTGSGQATGPVVFSWSPGNGVDSGTELSDPFSLNTQITGCGGPNVNGHCSEPGTSMVDTGTGMFQAVTGTLAGGDYTLTALFEAHQQTAGDTPVSTPEPATLGLMILGLAGVRFMRRRRAR